MSTKHEITLPENISEVTLRQFLRLQDLEKQDFDVYTKLKRKISIFTGIPFNKMDRIKQIDFERINSQIDLALSKEVPFVNRFELNGIEYGFIPNLDKISLGEYVDLTNYGVSEETLPQLMSVLFRPIINKEGSNYEIMPYKGSEEFVEVIKDMPLNCVNGALVFFWNLANELQEATQKYLSEELQKEMRPYRTSRISAGFQQLKSWLTTTFSK